MSLTELRRYLEEARGTTTTSALESYWNLKGPMNGGLDRKIPHYHPRLRHRDVIQVYRAMYTSRRCDDYELSFLKRGLAWFTISAAGAEAVLAAAGKALRNTDPMCPYYRDRTTCLIRGVTPYEMFLEALACADDPASGGHQMPAHWGHEPLGIISQTSPTGSQCLPALGIAEAVTRTRAIMGSGRFPNDAVVYVSIGDASINQGEFYESVKQAVLSRSPLVVHVLDNGWGISTPDYEQHGDFDPGDFFKRFPGVTYLRCDGTDFRQSFDALSAAVERCRSGRGPVLVHSKVVRLYSHSASDDQRKYRTPSDVGVEEERDPIPKFARELIRFDLASAEDLLRINEEIEAELRDAADRALKQPKTDVERIEVCIHNYDKANSKKQYEKYVAGRKSKYAGQNLVMAEAINRAISELMETDKRIVMWGEDIADVHQKYLKISDSLEGKGGVFGVTRGLQKAYPGRVWNAPLAEASIVGKAMGYSLQGFLPVIEVQFRDFLNPAWQQLVDEIATLSFRSNAKWRAPMVIRMASGGYLLGAGAIWHSELAAGPLLYHPGLMVAVPSNARNAAAAIRGAIYSGDPVVFLECKALYRRRGGWFDTPYPDFDYVAWPGEGTEIYGEGKDLTLISWGNTTPICIEAMKPLEGQGVKTRLVNLVWLHPLDEKSVRTHAEATGKVLIVDEDRRRCGASSHVADAIYGDRALRRKVDVERLCSKNSRVPYGAGGEQYVLPQVQDVVRTALELVKK